MTAEDDSASPGHEYSAALEALLALDNLILASPHAAGQELRNWGAERGRLLAAVCASARRPEELDDARRATAVLERHFHHLRRLLAPEARRLQDQQFYIERPASPAGGDWEFFG
jgi:hypothetical protein